MQATCNLANGNQMTTGIIFTPHSELKQIIEDIGDVDIICVDIEMLFSVLIEDIFTHASNGIDPEYFEDEVARQTFLTVTDVQNEMTVDQLEALSKSIFKLSQSLVENLKLLSMLYEQCAIFRYGKTLPDGSIYLQSTGCFSGPL